MILFASEHAGLIGLLFFFVFFVLMVLWLMLPGAKEKAKDSALIPLKEDEA